MVSTFKYSCVYMPFPGPPAENDPPPPMRELSTAKAKKSASRYELLSRAKTM